MASMVRGGADRPRRSRSSRTPERARSRSAAGVLRASAFCLTTMRIEASASRSAAAFSNRNAAEAALISPAISLSAAGRAPRRIAQASMTLSMYASRVVLPRHGAEQ